MTCDVKFPGIIGGVKSHISGVVKRLDKQFFVLVIRSSSFILVEFGTTCQKINGCSYEQIN